MDIDLFGAKVWRKLHGWLSPYFFARDIAVLERFNFQSHAKLLDPEGPVVSLTTHGIRLDSVYLTIESIGRGMQKPSRLILWLDDPVRFAALPESLLRLQQRGLEILLTQNYGPHTKYYPYVASIAPHRVSLVTADDDIIYPPTWLRDLFAAAQRTPNTICCFRAHRVVLQNDANQCAIAPYRQWPPCETRATEALNFGTGVSGVIYPAVFLDYLHRANTAFLQCCSKADDIWLHAMAVRAGIGVRQIGRLPRHFPNIPGTQEMGLVHSNSTAGGNDVQIKKTYQPADIEALAR